ncbi:MAG: hypothetical protein JXR80_08555 [Deltaproteobacteria bacterium]|nr:hypothetical protein [Deltaproteobacteria bacterium]
MPFNLQSRHIKKLFSLLTILFALGACGSRGGMQGLLTSSDVLIIQHHLRQHYRCLEEFCRRLYLKNPKYESDVKKRRDKLAGIFKNRTLPDCDYDKLASHEVLTAVFSEGPDYYDRVALLGLGLRKSIDEGYGQAGPEEGSMVTSLQVSLELLKRLYSNISQVKWRLKVSRDDQQKLYFQTNALAPEGHLNMGYEVLLTKVLTRIEDDIYMRGGNPPNLIFNMSTMFLTLLL